MNKRVVRTAETPAPFGPYSQAIVAGDFVFCAGQIALDPATGALVAGGIRHETARVLENLLAVLREAGCSMENVVKTTIYLRDMNDFAAVNEVYGTFFKDNPPARATVQAARLPRDAGVEIDCIALRVKG